MVSNAVVPFSCDSCGYRGGLEMMYVGDDGIPVLRCPSCRVSTRTLNPKKREKKVKK